MNLKFSRNMYLHKKYHRIRNSAQVVRQMLEISTLIQNNPSIFVSAKACEKWPAEI